MATNLYMPVSLKSPWIQKCLTITTALSFNNLRVPLSSFLFDYLIRTSQFYHLVVAYLVQQGSILCQLDHLHC